MPDHRDLVIEALAAELAELKPQARAMREIVVAGWDYIAWLQGEVCRARQWTALDVLDAWHQELERRAKARAEMAA